MFLASASHGTGPEAALKEQVTQEMKVLFYHLDVLSSIHYTPKLVEKSAEIKT
jgi:hypothetical protein